MEFHENLRTLRTDKGLTQQALANMIKIQVLQIRRYESGQSQPMLDVIRRLAIALECSTDELIFGGNERGPRNRSLRHQLEAIEQLSKTKQEIIIDFLDAMSSWYQKKY